MKPENYEAFEKENIYGLGAANDAFRQYFIGNSYLNAITEPGAPLPVHNVTFEPGCRNNWHIHKASSGGGQLLICVAGEGWYVAEGEAPKSLHPGMAVTIPAGVKHWHGAKKDCWFSHLAIEIPGQDCRTEWCEPVDDEEYGKLS